MRNRDLEAAFRIRFEETFFQELHEFYKSPGSDELYSQAMQKWPRDMWTIFSRQLDIELNQQVHNDLKKVGKKSKKSL